MMNTTASVAPSVLVVGCGDIGTRLAESLLADNWRVAGLRRDAQKLPAAVAPILADLHRAELPGTWPQACPDYLVFCPAAGEHSETAYRALYVNGLAHCLAWLGAWRQRPKRLLFVSSTGVYGQNGGEWVDEDSPTDAMGFSGRLMREAENLALFSEIPTTVVRLAGIYGPGRGRLLRRAGQGAWAAAQPVQFSNRIHSQDAAGLLAFLLRADARGMALDDCYLGVDDEPAPLHEVLDWLRQRLAVVAQADAQERRASGSKRCSNARARTLGWRAQYPSYREGYAALLADS